VRTIIQKVINVLYFCFWVVFAIGFLFFWLITFHNYMYLSAVPLICGFLVGMLSGLSPARSFLAGFLAYFIIAVQAVTSNLEDLAFFTIIGIFCGSAALASAALRRVALRSKTEQLHLATWQWAILIGVASALACYVVISFPYVRVDFREDFSLVSKFISLALMGLFALGFYAGACYQRNYREIVRNILLFSLGGHLVFVFFIVYIVRFWRVWKDPLFFPMMAVYFLVLLLGIRVGYRIKKRKNTQIQENGNTQS
jgi:hypothetical protein